MIEIRKQVLVPSHNVVGILTVEGEIMLPFGFDNKYVTLKKYEVQENPKPKAPRIKAYFKLYYYFEELSKSVSQAPAERMGLIDKEGKVTEKGKKEIGKKPKKGRKPKV